MGTATQDAAQGLEGGRVGSAGPSPGHSSRAHMCPRRDTPEGTEPGWSKSLSRVQLDVTLWTVAHQAPLSLEFSRPEYWSRSLLQGIFPTQGSNPGLLHCRRILYH